VIELKKALATRRRRWAAIALTIGTTLGIALVGFGWYASDQIADGALRPRDGPRSQELTVVAAGDGLITLRAGGDSNWRREGIWGLQWSSGMSDGYARVGAPRAIDDQRREVTRPLLAGEPPPSGARARLDNVVFDGTPASVGLSFEDVRYSADGGPTPAWLVAGDRDTWLVFVHGRGVDRKEALRVLPTIAALNIPSLVISYRNDAAAPEGASGHYAYGRTEWRDVEAAVSYARDSGARDVLLYGASMGGGIVMSFLYRSELAASVRGVILDAPMLRFRATVEFGLAEAGVPAVYRWLPMWIAERRFDIAYGDLDYLARTDELRAPILLFHGSDDDIIPIALSDELAAARPDLVRYERVEGAHHVGAWNVDPARYEAAVTAFLESVAARPAGARPSTAPATLSGRRAVHRAAPRRSRPGRGRPGRASRRRLTPGPARPRCAPSGAAPTTHRRPARPPAASSRPARVSAAGRGGSAARAPRRAAPRAATQ
jgi:pimeloyl-ACP methyl ester carboxylesterase